jgi:hypothetical protein
MKVSFIHVDRLTAATKTRDLGTKELAVVPRVGEQVIIDLADAMSWDVVSVVHDTTSETTVCYVARTEVMTHRLAIIWDNSLPEPAYELPVWLECAVVPRVGDTITLAVMNHDQLEALEQVRELDADDYEHETVEDRVVVVEVRHEADRDADNTARVAAITLIVAPT